MLLIFISYYEKIILKMLTELTKLVQSHNYLSKDSIQPTHTQL